MFASFAHYFCEIHLYGLFCSPLCIHFAVTGHLGSSQFFKTSAALSILVPGFGEHLHGFLLDIYPEMELIA